MNNTLLLWKRFSVWNAKQDAQNTVYGLNFEAEHLNKILGRYDLGVVAGGTKTFKAVATSLRHGALKRAEKRPTEELVTDVVAYAGELERRLNGGANHA